MNTVETNVEANVNFLKGAEDALNRKLHAKGYLLPIDFYEALGYLISPEDPRFNAAKQFIL